MKNSFLKRLLTLRLRKKRRFRAKKGLVAISDKFMGKHQIDDISMGGFSYYYIDHGIHAKSEVYQMRLQFNGDNQLHLACKTISDEEAAQILLQRQIVKRKSVHFVNLTRIQKKALRELIRNYAA